MVQAVETGHMITLLVMISIHSTALFLQGTWTEHRHGEIETALAVWQLSPISLSHVPLQNTCYCSSLSVGAEMPQTAATN